MSKGAETRKRIIEKAAPLFNKKGYDGCSMQDVVAAVGLEKGSLYGHFATKEELALEAFDYAWEETCSARLNNMDKVPNSVDKLRLHIENLITCPPFPGGCPLMNTAVDADDGGTGLRNRARGALQDWHDLLQKIVREGQTKGEIQSNVDPERISALIICLIEGASGLDRLGKKSQLLEMAKQHLDFYLERHVRVT